MSDINPKPVIGQTSAEVELLVTRLSEMRSGVLVAYSELSALVGADIVKKRHLLASARRIVLKEYRKVFRPVVGEGIRCLDDVEVVDICPRDRRKRARSQARNAIRELSAVHYDALPKDKQVEQNVGMAVFGGIISGTERSEMKRLQNQVENGSLPELSGTFKLIGWTS